MKKITLRTKGGYRFNFYLTNSKNNASCACTLWLGQGVVNWCVCFHNSKNKNELNLCHLCNCSCCHKNELKSKGHMKKQGRGVLTKKWPRTNKGSSFNLIDIYSFGPLGNEQRLN